MKTTIDIGTILMQTLAGKREKESETEQKK